MNKYITFLFFSLFTVFIISCESKPKENPTTGIEDLIEPRPEKKINQSPPKKIDESKGISTGTFSHLEDGEEHYYFHIKKNNQRESFMLRTAYDGANQLNIDNWKTVKGKKVKITWEAVEEKSEDGSSIKFKKVVAVNVLN